MPYQAELDDRPLYVVRGFSGNVLRWWPKIMGEGNVQAADAPAPTFNVYTPDDDLIGASNRAVTVAEIETIDRFSLPIDASDTDTYELKEGYRAEITWTYGGDERIDVLRFGVARALYEPRVSLNDFVEDVADAEQYLTGQAEAIESGRTAEQHASVLGVKAWVDVYRMLQTRLRNEGKIFPRLIIDQWRIHEVVIAQAIYRMFRSEAGSRESERAKEWKQEASERFGGLAELDYDENEDAVADTVLPSVTERRLERRW